MFEMTEFPFLDDTCLLMICYDAEVDGFAEHLQQLYDPDVRTVHVCVDKRLNFIRRAKMLRQVRKIFAVSDIDIRNVSTAQIRLLGFFIHSYIPNKKGGAVPPLQS